MTVAVETSGFENERWLPVTGWEGVYEISDHGRLKSFKKDLNGRILSNKNKKGHYFSVVLYGSQGMKSTRIHRLVAEHFIPNPENLPTVNHKDLNKQNNRASNLEWASQKENNKHFLDARPERRNHLARLNKEKARFVAQCDLSGGLIKVFRSSKHASDATGVCKRNIHQVAAKSEYKPGLTRRQAGGYVWKFIKTSK